MSSNGKNPETLISTQPEGDEVRSKESHGGGVFSKLASKVWGEDERERRYVQKLDTFLFSYVLLGYFIKYLDQNNYSNAFVSGMQEELQLYVNERNPSTQRNILVKLDKPPGDYALRLHSLRNEQIIQGVGILRYPTTRDLSGHPNRTVPQQASPISSATSSRSNGFLKNGSVVDLIIENGAKMNASHPFHKHNHKVWIIGQGEGGFTWKDVDDALKNGGTQYFNTVDPPHRDGFTLYAGEGRFVVVRYKITFPAVSMLHCHMIHHFASGQQVILLEGMEVMPPVPQELKDKPHVEFQFPLRYGPLD
ncbi:Multicopper oxidase GIP1 [Colletotrichum sidae]|uniref:Multicopper oxidase GIP1 n=1 Tax=Colletotrichum sidae TaxID=1347389 RepID=A0A4R8T5G1_9PEZI|nr:Multicopper oxidase GIP1 [Colletotrichum sidae]